jgi:hypothetical protein
MKSIKLTIALIQMITFMSSCKKDVKEVDSDGLTNDITTLVPQSVLNEMKSMGLKINGGNTPPVLSQSFTASPFIMTASNIADDQSSIGSQFTDFRFTFTDFNAKDLTLKLNYNTGGSDAGNGIGCYVVGSNNEFTIFASLVNSNSNNEKAQIVMVLSGTYTSNGISNLQNAAFMINNYGNPNGTYIANGKGRVFVDGDKFTEIR